MSCRVLIGWKVLGKWKKKTESQSNIVYSSRICVPGTTLSLIILHRVWKTENTKTINPGIWLADGSIRVTSHRFRFSFFAFLRKSNSVRTDPFWPMKSVHFFVVFGFCFPKTRKTEKLLVPVGPNGDLRHLNPPHECTLRRNFTIHAVFARFNSRIYV